MTSLAQLGAGEEGGWRVSSALLMASTLGLVHINAVKGFHERMRRMPEYSPPYARFLFTVGLGTAVSFGLAPAALVRPQAGYVPGVTLLLGLASLQLLRTISRAVLRLPWRKPGQARRKPGKARRKAGKARRKAGKARRPPGKATRRRQAP